MTVPQPLTVLRVSQLDAELLDGELTGILRDQLLSVFSLFKSSVKEKFEPEIMALLHFVMYQLSIYSTGATYGLQLQNLKYRDESRHKGRLEVSSADAPLSKRQKLLHALLCIVGPWGWLRLNRYATTQGWSEMHEASWYNKIWHSLQKFENWYRGLSLLNLLVFLYNGRYRSLVDRILGMRLVYKQREMSRQVSFEFMNRQLVWQAFTEFLMFLVPLVNIEKIKNTISQSISGPTIVTLPDHLCAICHANNANRPVIQVPYITNCGHKYCYYCIKTSMMVDSSYHCLRCGQQVKEITRALD
ncbi:Pex12 amino terminal region-domain-containing protein [Fimicolochytrium jonesii]|uniref:Pex12 amino terminal region-domain-containing protein n=1 Tax=Fimicolochytrium jonesii TaxID=1396493 RepID=UPI0022FE18F8|nr:Pex12 amino terminal region-domain-containing protein [Fimicolochytrium jonesii]KAI8817923.1 Pex12 amino terminal region-domain-containing protein [Fimicolochytrium jonesii]